jgi:hypothetical protein
MKSIENLTIKEAKEKLAEYEQLTELFGKSNGGVDTNHPFEVGKFYFIRTVTMHLVGKLIAVYDKELVLQDCAWVADNGRFHKFVNGELDNNCEIEPFPDGKVLVGRGSLLDCTIWKGKPLRSVK